MSLHPEVEKMIALGPKAMTVGGNPVVEDDRAFARRIALRAVKLEREAMRDAFIDALIETDATWSVGEARDVAEEAIRRGGSREPQ